MFKKCQHGLRIGCLYYDIGQFDIATKYLREYSLMNQDQNALDLLNECTMLKETENWNFWIDFFFTLNDKLLSNASDQANIGLLYDLDKAVNIITTICQFDISRQLETAFITHFHAEFCLHAASQLLQRGQPHHKVVPLLVMAAECQINENARWTKHSGPDGQKFVATAKKQSSWRRFQAIKVLESGVYKDSNGDIWQNLKKVLPNSCTPFCTLDEMVLEARHAVANPVWKTDIYRDLFGERKVPATGSYWLESKEFGLKNVSPTWTWPEFCVQFAYDESTLAQQIYLLLAQNFDQKFSVDFLESFKRPETVVADTILNKTDIYAFLFACTIEAQSKLTKNHATDFVLLPYGCMVADLCTEEQSTIWKSFIEVNILNQKKTNILLAHKLKF